MKNVYKKSFIPALLVIILSGIARAEDIYLDKIVVTPSRIEESSENIGRTVDVVTSLDIERSGAQDLAGALTNLTSVDISNYGGPNTEKSIRMRGSTSAQVLVLMDGRPINNPRDGSVDLSSIPLDNISRVEIMHGPGSSLYGSSAMGGVVNIITKNPPREGQKAEVYSSFGTARTYIERMLYGAKVSKLGFLVSGGYESSQGFRENSELNAKDCNLKLGYDLNNENNVSFNSGFYKSKSGAPGTINYFDADDKQNILKRFFDLNWKFQPDEQTGLSGKAYQNYDRLEFMENTAGPTWGDVANQKDIHATTVRGLDLQLDKQLLDIYKIVCGFNYVKNMNDSTSSAKHEYNVTAGYLENRLDLFDNKLNVNLSARIDDYSNFGTEINPSLSILYKFNESIKLHGLISRSFRAPTFNDLYWSSPGMLSNPNLNPEKGLTGEIGLESKLNEKILLGVTYYRSKYNGLIQWAPLTDDPYGDWSVKNIGSAIIDGIELSNKISITENLEADLNYTYMIAKDAETHNFLIYQPQNKADFCLKYKDLKGFQIELKGQFTGRRFINSNNTVSLKQFFVFGLSVSKKFKSGITCFGYIDNLLNRKYQVQSGYPMPGFSLTGGLKAEF
ncbi:MAG: TonB-dependent receptor [Candidatus Omnitrophica bacterium]|nr:TonB-dependent receptor [Candidatus Omnitrophota bacterium]MBU1924003.1 TonB-dependent receptor [Candidatus Omnitrophota bacterium]